jgi:hypothetical protein
LVWVFHINTSAQQKFERESRLKAEDVPTEALKFIDAVEMNTRWKWYFEENLVGNSVEAKTKHKGKRYSVEFDVAGNIQDVEIEMNWQKLDELVRRNVSDALDSLFTRHKIDKIQIQYYAESTILLAFLNNEVPAPQARIQYEIVVKGKTTGRPKLYELTFSDNGKLFELSEIIFRNTDNLEY